MPMRELIVDSFSYPFVRLLIVVHTTLGAPLKGAKPDPIGLYASPDVTAPAFKKARKYS